MLLIFVLYALFGSVFTAAKLGLDHAEPFFLVGSRMVIAGILLLLFLFVKNRKELRVKSSHVRPLILLALFNIYITNGFEFWGMKYLTSSKTSFIYSLSPFFAAVMSWLFLKEKLSRKKLLGLVIGFAGFIPVLWKQTTGEDGLASLGIFSLAELSVMAAAMATVYGWITMRKLVSEGMSPMLANGFSMIIGGFFALVHSSVTESWNPVPVNGSWSVYAETTLWMILISSFICYNLYGHLLKKYTVTFMAFSGFSTPFFTALFSWFKLGESVDSGFYFSALIVFIGLFLFYQEELKKEGLVNKDVLKSQT